LIKIIILPTFIDLVFYLIITIESNNIIAFASLTIF